MSKFKESPRGKCPFYAGENGSTVRCSACSLPTHYNHRSMDNEGRAKIAEWKRNYCYSAREHKNCHYYIQDKLFYNINN